MERKNHGAKRFICVLLSAALFLSAAMCVAAYAYDPQNVYRWNTRGVRYYHPLYSAAGALAHYDYDTVIIGSSMVQNWDAQALAASMRCKPLKVTAGAMTPAEILYLYDAARQSGKARTYIINVDLHRVASAEDVSPDSGRFPSFMFGLRGVRQLQYLLGFQTWLRFMPLDALLCVTQRFSLPAAYANKIREATDINAMCVWDESVCMDRQAWIHTLRNGESGFNEGDNTFFRPDAAQHMRQMLEHFSDTLGSGERLVLYLPPYSALYWALKTPAQLETLLELRQIMSQCAQEDARITVLDFQSIPQVEDLSLYVDANHCGAQIRKFVESALAGDAYAVTPMQTDENNAQIRLYAEKLQALRDSL